MIRSFCESHAGSAARGIGPRSSAAREPEQLRGRLLDLHKYVRLM